MRMSGDETWKLGFDQTTFIYRIYLNILSQLFYIFAVTILKWAYTNYAEFHIYLNKWLWSTNNINEKLIVYKYTIILHSP
jgi:hypothetical protein